MQVKATASGQVTELFWPFSSPPSKKVVATPAVQILPSPSAKAVASDDNDNLESQAVQQARKVMRKLVLEDDRAARKAAKDEVCFFLLIHILLFQPLTLVQYLKNLVAQHIQAAKAAAEAKLASAKAAILKSKLAAQAHAASARAAAKLKQQQKLLRAQFCRPLANQKPLTRQQCALCN